MTDRLEDAIVALSRAHVRAALMRDRRTADLIDEARELVQAEIVDQRLTRFVSEFDQPAPPPGKTLTQHIDDIAGFGDSSDDRGWGFQ